MIQWLVPDIFSLALQWYTSSLAGEREEKRGKIHKTLVGSGMSQQTLVCLLGQFDKRFFQRSSTILALAHDALTERQGLPSYFVCFEGRARAVLGLGGNSSHMTSSD